MQSPARANYGSQQTLTNHLDLNGKTLQHAQGHENVASTASLHKAKDNTEPDGQKSALEDHPRGFTTGEADETACGVLELQIAVSPNRSPEPTTDAFVFCSFSRACGGWGGGGAYIGCGAEASATAEAWGDRMELSRMD